MFRLFKSKKYEPLIKEHREFFEYNLLWLMKEFPEPEIKKRKVLTPSSRDFPIRWNRQEPNALEALKIICENMQINQEEIELEFFSSAPIELDSGSGPLYTQSDPDHRDAAGLFHTEKFDDKFLISLDRELLKAPENLIATMAHELAHVKLLGEKELNENDEMLTDLATVFFGLGIFNANSAFQFFKGNEKWGYQSLGYLKIEEWAYALALFAYLREEEPIAWKPFLSKSILRDFERSYQYLLDHQEEIFVFEED